MATPVHLFGAAPLSPLRPPGAPGTTRPAADGAGPGFKDMLLDKLNEVSKLQTEAGDKVQDLITGETKNYAEVFSAVRKADVAFSLLMEIRNKLMDAYEQIQQMRV